MAGSLFQRDKIILLVITVFAFTVIRNTYFLASSRDGETFDPTLHVNNPPSAESGDISSGGVAQLLRSAVIAKQRSNDQNEKKPAILDRIVFNNSSLINSSLNKDNKVKNDTKHTLLKANMSHIGEIVKGFKADPKPDEQVKFAKPHPFKYIINSPNICGNEDIYMIIYIHTAPDHHKRRTVIRQTWGNLEHYDVPVRLIFVMGVSKLIPNLNDTDIQKALFFESEQYGDMVQEDFLDTYHNLTHKGVTALKWITNYCSQAMWVLKTDDDIFVNSYTLMRHLKRLQKQNKVHGQLMCAVWYEMTVIREGKWKVTYEEWPNSTYPTYCSGSAFILSTDVAITLYKVSYHVPFFWIDDFYITGLLPLKAGNVNHTSIGSTFVLNGDRLEEMFTGPSWFMYIFSHVHDLNRIQAVWDIMTKYATGVMSPTIKMAQPGDLGQLDTMERKIGLL